MSETLPVIRKAVSFAYNGEEVVDIVKAAHQLPPYKLDLGPSRLRIDCHSVVSGSWRCAFVFTRTTKKGWTLEAIEYDLGLTMKRALASLGELEEMGLKQLKYGL
jgi:hypothetical protein